MASLFPTLSIWKAKENSRGFFRCAAADQESLKEKPYLGPVQTWQAELIKAKNWKTLEMKEMAAIFLSIKDKKYKHYMEV